MKNFLKLCLKIIIMTALIVPGIFFWFLLLLNDFSAHNICISLYNFSVRYVEGTEAYQEQFSEKLLAFSLLVFSLSLIVPFGYLLLKNIADILRLCMETHVKPYIKTKGHSL